MTPYSDNVDRIGREVDALLRSWEAGESDARAVWNGAERIWAAYEWDVADVDPATEIVGEVVTLLESLPHQMVVIDDVPAIRRFLATPAGQAHEGWERWTAYWNGIDFADRAARLASDPLYAPTG
jgi:hypothetical protein